MEIRKHNWNTYNYSKLQKIKYLTRRKPGHKFKTLNDVIITMDTETSKKDDNSGHNHVVVWTIGILCEDVVDVLIGRKPSEMVKCIKLIQENLRGEETDIFVHNLGYDYTFLRLFLFNGFGYPISQLAVGNHHPITITFDNGVVFRDSLIIGQRKLERWCEDLKVEHQKAVGFWDYDKLRNQNTPLSKDELTYISFDVVGLCECIDTYMKNTGLNLLSLPLTATGLVRKDIQELAHKNKFKPKFNELSLTYADYEMMRDVYHGGLVHGNSIYITDKLVQETLRGHIICYDFTSSYPSVLMMEKYPTEPFKFVGNLSLNEVRDMAETHAIFGRLNLVNVRIKEGVHLPTLQFSKCQVCENYVLDNGRVLAADIAIINTHEQRVLTILEDYDFDYAIMMDCRVSRKGYLPKWLRDYIMRLFTDKCELKGGDPILYALAKARLNSIYGLFVQRPYQLTINEDYKTGEYSEEDILPNEEEERYDKSIKSRNKVLPYQWGVWCTAYAERNLILLSRCCHDWIYGDTDSAMGREWDNDMLNAYNENVKAKLRKAGYDKVSIDGKDYWIGVASYDKEFSEFRFTGAKRYCGRDIKSGKLKLTVAGVPKDTGVLCLKDNIENFVPGFKFKGEITNKKIHTYYFLSDEGKTIYTDAHGNETGDSIDLNPCDYELDSATIDDLSSYYSSTTVADWSYCYE